MMPLSLPPRWTAPPDIVTELCAIHAVPRLIRLKSSWNTNTARGSAGAAGRRRVAAVQPVLRRRRGGRDRRREREPDPFLARHLVDHAVEVDAGANDPDVVAAAVARRRAEVEREPDLIADPELARGDVLDR